MMTTIGASLAVSALVILYVAARELADRLRERRMRRQDGRAIEAFLASGLRGGRSE